ncbi:MAG: type II secretion system F family protein [Patescibacteria group bacterium]
MRFKYLAHDEKGASLKGFMDASDKRQVTNLLFEQKLTPVSVEEVHQSININAWLDKIKGVSLDEISTFTRQLATMLNAGLPLTDALNLLKLQSSSTIFTATISQILDDVQSGLALSVAMQKHPKIFSKVFVALIKAGESAGVMETILNRLADNLEKSRDFESKVKGALIYPAIVFVGMIGVMVLMMVVVVPKLTGLYKEFNADLPLPTKILMGMSDFMVNYWPLALALAIGGFFATKSFFNSPRGRRIWDERIFSFPVVGNMLREIMLTELTRTLSLLVGAGVSIVEGLNVVAEATGNVIAEEELRKIIKKVEKGFPLSVSFSESPSFLPIIGQMIAVGEETGKLDEVLSKLSKYFENSSEAAVKGLTTAIEPLIIILLGVGVGFLIFTVVMPIYNLTNQF